MYMYLYLIKKQLNTENRVRLSLLRWRHVYIVSMSTSFPKYKLVAYIRHGMNRLYMYTLVRLLWHLSTFTSIGI